MRVLGIDPGSRLAGYAVVEAHQSQFQLITKGVFDFRKTEGLPQKCGQAFDDLKKIVQSFRPQAVALESLIFVKNPASLMKLAQVRGAFLSCLAHEFENNIFEYSPNLIKSSVSGHGHATKEVLEMGLQLFLGPQNYETHDVSDAAAVALCHFLNQNNSRPRSRKGSLEASLAHKLTK